MHPSGYDDLTRPPLTRRSLARLTAEGALWREVRLLTEVDSTNRVAAEAARAGAPEGLVVVAEAQTGGRGRQGRSWSSPPRAGLLVSVLLRPTVEPARWGWLPLLGGLAVARAVTAQTGVPVGLKWPNDLLAGPGERKLAGLLAEALPATGAHGPAVVLGLGLNVTTTAAELPEGATSLAWEGARSTDRSPLLRGLLRELAGAYDTWHVDREPVERAYAEACLTLGRRVRVEVIGRAAVEGTADGIAADGSLLVDGVPHSAGDVTHLRHVPPR